MLPPIFPRDVNWGGSKNGWDNQQPATCTTGINKDGQCNVIDVQHVTNAPATTSLAGVRQPCGGRRSEDNVFRREQLINNNGVIASVAPATEAPAGDRQVVWRSKQSVMRVDRLPRAPLWWIGVVGALAMTPLAAQATGSGLQIGLVPSGLQSLRYNGVDYAWPGIGYIVYEFWTPPGGAEGPQTASTLVATSSGTTYVTQLYRTDANHAFALRFDYVGEGSDTLGVRVSVTNQASYDTLRLAVSPLALQLPDVPSVLPGDTFNWFGDYPGLPLAFLKVDQQSLGWWLEPANANIQVGSYFRATGQKTFTIDFQSRFGNPPRPWDYSEAVAAGQTKNWTLNLRFSGDIATKETIAPEAIANYRQAFPYIVNWPDRRPVSRFFISNPNTNRVNCTPQNPRCFIFNTNALGDPAGFRQGALAFADQTIAVWNSMSVRPQGGILWDLEGQEFLQYFSYVGDPAHLHDLAPEMDAIADEFIGRFQQAGYKVGLTLRPDYALYGTILPSACYYAAGSDQSDVFVKIDGSPMFRGYACTAPNTWTQPGQAFPYFQTNARTYDALLQTMRSKIGYAYSRWGIRMFYVDSNGPWPNLWRDLVQEFPDVVFFPEHRHYGSYGAASAYIGDQPMVVWGTEPTPELLWENKPFSLILADLDQAHFADQVAAIRQGDIMLFDGWYRNPGVDLVESLYAAAGQPPASPCDVNKDNATNVLDVQLAVNQALGVTACTADINKDGLCNVLDVQRVTNAALGGQCVSP